MGKLHEDEHLVVSVMDTDRIIVVRRNATMPSPETIVGFAWALRRALGGLDRSSHALLVDLRAAPLRSGPELEKALATFRDELGREVRAIARLVATAVGALQVARLDGTSTKYAQCARSFDDEAQALAWLREELAKPSNRKLRA
jgi:hypothetical protein